LSWMRAAGGKARRAQCRILRGVVRREHSAWSGRHFHFRPVRPRISIAMTCPKSAGSARARWKMPSQSSSSINEERQGRRCCRDPRPPPPGGDAGADATFGCAALLCLHPMVGRCFVRLAHHVVRLPRSTQWRFILRWCCGDIQ